MAIISDKNFTRFLSEDLNLNKYVLTESLEPIERTTYNLFIRGDELNKVAICEKITIKFQEFASIRDLTSKEKEQAVKNLKGMQAKFSGSTLDTDSLKCRGKLQMIIDKIQKSQQVPITRLTSAVTVPEKMRRSSSSYSLPSPLSETNSSSPQKTIKPPSLFSKSVVEGLESLAKLDRENVGKLFPAQKEVFPSLNKKIVADVPPPIEPKPLRSLSSLFEELKIQNGNADQAVSFQLLDEELMPSPRASNPEPKVKKDVVQRIEAHFPKETWANQTYDRGAENEAPRDVSRVRSRRETETPRRNSKSQSPTRDASVIPRRGRKEEAAPTSPRQQPTERTRRFQIT